MTKGFYVGGDGNPRKEIVRMAVVEIQCLEPIGKPLTDLNVGIEYNSHQL